MVMEGERNKAARHGMENRSVRKIDEPLSSIPSPLQSRGARKGKRPARILCEMRVPSTWRSSCTRINRNHLAAGKGLPALPGFAPIFIAKRRYSSGFAGFLAVTDCADGGGGAGLGTWKSWMGQAWPRNVSVLVVRMNFSASG